MSVPVVKVTLEVPEDVRRAVRVYAVREGLTNRGVWLTAVRQLGIKVSDDDIRDGRADVSRREARRP